MQENTNPGHDVIVVSATDLDDPTGSRYGEVRYSIVSKYHMSHVRAVVRFILAKIRFAFPEVEKEYSYCS